jgi:hypothetical protein
VAEKEDGMVDISPNTLGEAADNGMRKVRERSASMRMIFEAFVKHFLKALNGAI